MLGCSEAIVLDEVDQNYSRPHKCISGETLANLMRRQDHPYEIIDCRFDFEYSGGHIRGAVNISDP